MPNYKFEQIVCLDVSMFAYIVFLLPFSLVRIRLFFQTRRRLPRLTSEQGVTLELENQRNLENFIHR